MHSDPDSSETNSGWDSYWQGAGDAAAWSSDGSIHPAISGFWSEFFQSSIALLESPRIVDLGSGNGALVDHAFAAFGRDTVDVTCIDISGTAIASIRDRYPGVHAVVSDAADTGLRSAAFDMVISQFGVEYSGTGAVEEAVRLLAPDGRLAFLLHHEQSSIHRDCVAGLDATARVRKARFIPLAIDLFSAGFEAVRGADRAPYEEAATLLNPAVRAMESVIRDHGAGVAGGVIAHLYNDVSRMHQRIQHHEPSEVLGWLENMGRQLEEYAGRMSTMHAAALDERAFNDLCGVVSASECTIEQSGPLFAPDDAQHLAWAFLTSRGRS
jgi:SAM-dependent methyltransferase